MMPCFTGSILTRNGAFGKATGAVPPVASCSRAGVRPSQEPGCVLPWRESEVGSNRDGEMPVNVDVAHYVPYRLRGR